MSKLTQIQQGLKSMGQGEFQKLCEAYLYKQGHKDIWALGSVAGANKTKTGHPDTLIATPDAKFTLVEITTEQKKLFGKLERDLATIFNPEKTGIPLDKITQVILCFNSDIDATEQQSLISQAQENGCPLELDGLTKISNALYHDFPNLAKDFLNVSIDTGQILDQESFVKQYGKNALTTPLETRFHHRKVELKQMLESLESHNLLLVTGVAGVGKTRLALEALAHYKERHPDTDVKCILSRQQDIFEDTRAYFGQSRKSYLILVDDANRTSRFSYFIDLLQQADPGRVKVIAAVRDYALTTIQQELKQYAGYDTIRIERLDDQEIEKFVREEFNIQNQLYLTRISDLANGNPRLAVMMARLVVQENKLEGIRNISSLYHTYFDSIRREVEGLDEDETLKTAAIITYFRAVDRTNAQLATFIEEHFGLPQEQFWRSVRKLAEIEAVDLYENDIVKISDQSLATYFFYLTFFKRKLLDPSPFLIELFPATKGRLTDALSPCIEAFDCDLIVHVLKPIIQSALKEIIQCKDGLEQALEFLGFFWFVEPTTALLYARSIIRELEKSPEQKVVDLDQIKFEPDSTSAKPPLLRLLKAFSQAAPDDRRMAVQLILDWVYCSPTLVPTILDVLVRDFGFKQDSVLNHYSKQLELANELWTSYEQTDADLYARMLLCVAGHFLHTKHETTFTRGSTLHIRKFQLPGNDDVLKLREKLWEHVFSLWENPGLNVHVRTMIHTHANSPHVVSQKELIAADACHVLPALEKYLDPDRFEDCALIQQYLELLKAKDIPYDEAIEHRFRNRAYLLYEILKPYYLRRQKPDRDDYEEIHRSEVEVEFARYQRNEFQEFFIDVEQILRYYSHGPRPFDLEKFFDVLDWLREKKPDLFVEVMEDYLAAGNRLRLEQHGSLRLFVRSLLDIKGKDHTLSLFRNSAFSGNESWLFMFYDALKSEEIEAKDTQDLLELYQTTDPNLFPLLNGYALQKHLSHDSRIICKIAEIVIESAARDPQNARCLRDLLDNSRKFTNGLLPLFDGNVDLLKRVYFAVLATDRHIDDSGDVFDVLLSANSDFASDYTRWIHSHGQYLQSCDPRDYSFLWQREDVEEIVRKILRTILEMQFKALELFVPSLFILYMNKHYDILSQSRLRFMQHEIKYFSNDLLYMKLVFEIIAYFNDEEKRQLIAEFVRSNPKLDDFSVLASVLQNESFYECQIPLSLLQDRIDLYQSMLPILNSVDLLQHRQVIEIRIEKTQRYMERIKRDNFLNKSDNRTLRQPESYIVLED